MQVQKVVFLLLNVCVALSMQDLLKVSVYYETLCPDSVRFIVNQLYPTYQELNSIFTIDLVPYGKAIQNLIDGRWKFECQHGPSECYGNKMQACALNQTMEFSKKLDFIYCLMGSVNPAKSGEECSKRANVTWEPIRACTNSRYGDNLLAAMGDRTHSVEPQISFVPTVIFNDAYNDSLQWEAIKDLRAVICRLLDNPRECL